VDSEWRCNAGWIAAHFKPSLRFADGFSIGGGVTWHAFRARDGYDQSFPFNRFGLMTEAAVRLPRATQIFYGLTLRAHVVPGSAEMPHGTRSGPVVLRATWSYVTAAASVGIRL
jgi:hypothetical protein